ncbi:alpha-L-fucosidase [Clostridium nigeriense]|uniref:alpha-L-fucosidase n=1 Tax=Clostridium nigeriense TaxID=1805470 RepID=UPI003D34FD0C
MKRVKKLVSTIISAGMACQILPITAIAAELNTVKPPEAFGATPNESQLQYHEEELAAFIHFGMNTFTNSEWGNGKEDPNTFNPTDLDADEWVKTLKDAGFKRIIIVGKHHDGFAIWKSAVTEHDIEKSTDWQATQGGEGDVLEEVSKACTKYDMDMGIYLSPWDANAPSYGYGTGTNDETDSNGDYNEFYMSQLREILGNDKYGNNGRFVEVWMDGAKGSGAAAQNYKFEEWFDLIEELEPGAVVFSPYGSTVRWIGNESGKAGDPVWSKVNQKRIRDRYNSGAGDENQYLNNGDPNGDIWSVGECDVSLTSGWFWHSGNGPKTMEQLTDIYFSSVGRGQPLLLNVAPDKTGHFTSEDIARIKEFSSAINNSFDENLAEPTTTSATASSVRGNSNDYSANNVLDDNNDTYWTMDDGQTTGNITIDLGGEKTFDIVSIEEYIKLGQRVSEFSVETYSDGEWKEFGKGYTIGAKRLVRSAPVKATKIRINIKSSLAVPLIENVEVYKADEDFEVKSVVPSGTDFIDNVNFENKNSWTQENIGIGNTGMYSNTKGKDASFTFTGTKAWVIGTFDPGHGIMEVWVDGKKVSDVDTYNAKRSISQILYETDDLDYGQHTVKIVIKGEKNASSSGAFIGLDGAYYLNNNAAGMFEIEDTNYTVNEGETKEITIKRVGGSKGEATVHFSTSPDSAVHGRHYKDITKTIIFADGQTTAKVSIETIDNEEKGGNVKFYCNIDTPTNGAIIGFNKKSEVTIIDNDINIDKPYTEENPFVLPSTLEEKKLLEAELFTLNPIEGSKYVRITEKTEASNGKMVTWFETGNKIRVPFYAEKPGVYTFNMSYQSGRSEGNLNKVNWSGTNIESGSKSVPGTGNQNPVPIIKTSFDVTVTKAGAGELIFTADAQSSPNIDVFEVTPKDLKETTHTVTATAGENGSISPSGSVTLEEGKSKTFTFTPNEGYEVSDVIVDGASVGARDSHTIENIKKDMTISVIFKLKNTENSKLNSEENPIILTSEPIVIEAEKLELDGIGGEIENKEGANEGKVVGWLGNTSRGNAWLNMWVNSELAALYDIEIRYFAGANNTLYYTNNDESILGEIECNKTEPNFETKTIRVSLNKGLDKLKFFNNNESTVNIDSIKITKVGDLVDKSELNTAIEEANKIDTSKYTPKSLEKFNEAFIIAQNLASSEEATQEEVNEAVNTLKDAIEKLILIIDKTELNAVIESANKVDISKYTPKSLEKFNQALKVANSVVSNKEATQEEVNEAMNILNSTIENLVVKADKTELLNLIEESKTIDLDKYTNESVSILESLIKKSETIMSDENATQESVDSIKLEILNAIDNLVVANNDNNGNENNNNDNNNNDGNNNNSSGNNSNNNGSKNLPNTGSELGNISSTIAIALSSIGAILFRKKEK